MALERTYKLKCDGCGKVNGLDKFFTGGYSAPRRARAAAKADGWGRRTVIINQREMTHYAENPRTGQWEDDDTTWTMTTRAGKDFCATCLATMPEEATDDNTG